MWAEIGRLAADESLAVLLTTHYLDEADRLASRSRRSHALALLEQRRCTLGVNPRPRL